MKTTYTVLALVMVFLWACNQVDKGQADGQKGNSAEVGKTVDLGITEVLESLLDSVQRGVRETEGRETAKVESSAAVDTETADKNIQDEVQVVTLTPDQYTNQPVVVGQGGMGFQNDSLLGPVQGVKADDRCAVVRGTVAKTETNDTYKVKDAADKFDLEGVKLVTKGQEFVLSEEQIYFGNEQALGANKVASLLCQQVLVESSNTLYEGYYSEQHGCMVPFILDGVTYMAILGSDKGCSPFSFSDGDEVFLFCRYIEETGKAYVIHPVFVVGGEVWSPCFPVQETGVDEFEAELKGLLE